MTVPATALIADDDLDGWLRYPERVADEPTEPIAGVRCGQLLQYSAGSTGRPKGIRRPLDPRSAKLTTPVFEALVTGTATSYRPPPLLAERAGTAPLRWRVRAEDGTRREIARSAWQRFSITAR